MTNVGKAERKTQNRVIALFHDELDYDYLGEQLRAAVPTLIIKNSEKGS